MFTIVKLKEELNVSVIIFICTNYAESVCALALLGITSPPELHLLSVPSAPVFFCFTSVGIVALSGRGAI